MSKIAIIGLIGNSAFLSTDEFHKGGETIVAKEIHFEPGGKGFNQAVAASRMGAEVSFLGAIGNDYLKTVIDFCKTEGIKHFLPVKAENSAYASIITNSAGETRVTVYQGAKLEDCDIASFEREIETADVLLINNEVPESINEAAIQIAKKHKKLIILNPAPERETSDYILENVDYFTPNEYEASALSDKNNLIVTLGKNGCLIKETGETIPSFNAGKVVDTTGAGDTFNGALATLLGDGYSIKEAVEIATIAAGIGVTKKYAVSSIPKKEEVFSFYSK